MKEPDEEFEDEEGEIEEEKIPDALKEKWLKREREGLSGSTCKSCGAAVTEENLSCPVCLQPVEPDSAGLGQWLFGNWIGFAILLLITAAVILAMVRWY